MIDQVLVLVDNYRSWCGGPAGTGVAQEEGRGRVSYQA